MERITAINLLLILVGVFLPFFIEFIAFGKEALVLSNILGYLIMALTLLIISKLVWSVNDGSKQRT